MRWGLVVVIAACSGGPKLTVTTSFVVTDYTGTNPSPLGPLKDQTIDIEIVFPAVDSNHGVGNDPPGCKTQALLGSSNRTARGPTAATVQTQILDLLHDWDLRMQLCDTAAQSSVILEAAINELNLTFGCFGIPGAARVKDGMGYPEFTSFEAMQCSSTILDVVDNVVIGNHAFAMTIATGPDQLP